MDNAESLRLHKVPSTNVEGTFKNIATIIATNFVQSMEKHDYRLAVLKDRNRDLSKRWFVEFYAFNEETGKLQRYPIYLPAKYKTDAERRKYAKELVHEINAKLTQGFTVNSKAEVAKQETIKEDSKVALLITAFADAVAVLKVARKAGKSQKKYDTVYNVFEAFLKDKNFMDLSVQDFGSEHAQRYSNYLIVDRHNENTTRNYMYNHTRSVFDYFIRLNLIKENPFTEGKYKERPVVSNLAFSKQQKELIETYLIEHNIRLYYYTRFIYYLATRTDETIRLKIGDINFSNQTVNLLEESAKSSEMIVQPIPAPLWELITSQMKLNQFPSNYYIFGKNLETVKIPASKNYAYMKHRQILEKLSIFDNTRRNKYTLYSWKGTGADQAIFHNPDMDVLEIMHHLRHKNLGTTQTYVKARGLKVNEAMKKRRW
jgi:integrase